MGVAKRRGEYTGAFVVASFLVGVVLGVESVISLGVEVDDILTTFVGGGAGDGVLTTFIGGGAGEGVLTNFVGGGAGEDVLTNFVGGGAGEGTFTGITEDGWVTDFIEAWTVVGLSG